MVRPIQDIPIFRIEEIEVSKAILGCDCFVSWLYQGGNSPFRHTDGNLDTARVFDVMKTCADNSVSGSDISPPLVDVFKKLQEVVDKKS